MFAAAVNRFGMIIVILMRVKYERDGWKCLKSPV